MTRSQRTAPARARRTLAVAAATVAIAQLAVGLRLDAAPTRVRFRDAAHVLDVARRVDAPYVLFLGSSRFWQLDPNVATEALAATLGDRPPAVVQGAVPAGDAIVAEYLLDHLFAQHTPPALVLLEVSPETLANPAPWAAEHAIRFLRWGDLPGWASEIARGGAIPKVAAARFAPIQTYRRELLSWIVGAPPPYLRAPAAPGAPRATPPATPGDTSSPSSRWFDPSAARAAGPRANDDASPHGPTPMTLFGLRQTRRWLRHYRTDGNETAALARVLDRCRAAHVGVVLIGVPVSSFVRALYVPEVERRFRDVIAALGRRDDVEFVDYRDAVPDRRFKDHHHMTTAGGVAFTRVLADAVIAPRWRSATP